MPPCEAELVSPERQPPWLERRALRDGPSAQTPRPRPRYTHRTPYALPCDPRPVTPARPLTLALTLTLSLLPTPSPSPEPHQALLANDDLEQPGEQEELALQFNAARAAAGIQGPQKYFTNKESPTVFFTLETSTRGLKKSTRRPRRSSFASAVANQISEP